MQPLIWTLQAGQMTQDLPVKLLIVLKIILTGEEGGLNQTCKYLPIRKLMHQLVSQ